MESSFFDELVDDWAELGHFLRWVPEKPPPFGYEQAAPEPPLSLVLYRDETPITRPRELVPNEDTREPGKVKCLPVTYADGDADKPEGRVTHYGIIDSRLRLWKRTALVPPYNLQLGDTFRVTVTLESDLVVI